MTKPFRSLGLVLAAGLLVTAGCCTKKPAPAPAKNARPGQSADRFGAAATDAGTAGQSGDWVTPRLNGFLYFEKPALQYWMGAASFLVFGVNEFAARF